MPVLGPPRVAAARPIPLRLLAVAGFALGLASCAGSSRKSSSALDRSQAALANKELSELAREELDFLGEASLSNPPRELRKIQLLLDLLDRARFARDAEAKVKALRALGMPTSASAKGAQLWREASAQLLARAFDLEATLDRDKKKLDPDAAQAFADLIMLLSVDAHPPNDRADVESAALAVFELLRRGHAEVQDNAQWRYFDYLRALMTQISQSSPEEAVKLGWYSELGPRESLDHKLSPDPKRPAADEIHDQSHPSAEALVKVFLASLDPLLQDPRWQKTAKAQLGPSQNLSEAAIQALPRTRRGDWNLPRLRPEYAQADPWATLVVAFPGTVTLGTQNYRTDASSSLSALPWVSELRDRLVLDSRPDVVLAADEQLPAPELLQLLRGFSKAGVYTLHLAAYDWEQSREQAREESSTQEPEQHATIWTLAVDLGASQAQVAPGSLDLYLFAKSTRLAWDQQMHPKTMDTPLARLAAVQDWFFAYPTAQRIRIHLAPEVNYQQLFTVVKDLREMAKTSLRLEIAVHSPGALPPESKALPLNLRQRARWRFAPGATQPHPEVEIPEVGGMSGEDATDNHARVFAIAQRSFLCLPELQGARAKRSLDFTLDFVDGIVAEVQMRHKSANLPVLTQKRLRDCLQSIAQGFRLAKPHSLRARVSLPLPAPSHSRKPRG